MRKTNCTVPGKYYSAKIELHLIWEILKDEHIKL